MSIVDYQWTKMSASQAAVAKFLAKHNGSYDKRPMGRRLAEDAGLGEDQHHVATGLLNNLAKAGLIDATKSGGGRSWHSVKMQGLAREYIKENPYLGMTAGEAILEYLSIYGPVLTDSSASSVISEGTGYNATTISHELHTLKREEEVVVTKTHGKGGKYILGVRLPEHREDAETHHEAVHPLDPLAWLAARKPPEAQQLELDDTDDDTDPIPYVPEAVEAEEPSSIESLAHHLLALVIEKAGAQGVCENCKNSDEVVRATRQRINDYSAQLADARSELQRMRASYNELQGRYNSLRKREEELMQRLRNTPAQRISKYPLADEQKNALARLMEELPRG